MNYKTIHHRKPSGAPHTPVHSRYGTRLRLGGYIADIVPDGNKKSLIHHCIVQQIGSPEVLYLGQEDTFSAALENGRRQLKRLVAAHRPNAGAIYEFASVEALK